MSRGRTIDRIVFLYVTAPEAAAAAIAEALLAARAAACVKIHPRVHSIYLWKGAVERSDEAVLIVKTTAAKAAAARALIEAHHPYETPAIAAIDIDEARSGAAFLAWVNSKLKETNS